MSSCACDAVITVLTLRTGFLGAGLAALPPELRAQVLRHVSVDEVEDEGQIFWYSYHASQREWPMRRLQAGGHSSSPWTTRVEPERQGTVRIGELTYPYRLGWSKQDRLVVVWMDEPLEEENETWLTALEAELLDFHEYAPAEARLGSVALFYLREPGLRFLLQGYMQTGEVEDFEVEGLSLYTLMGKHGHNPLAALALLDLARQKGLGGHSPESFAAQGDPFRRLAQEARERGLLTPG